MTEEVNNDVAPEVQAVEPTTEVESSPTEQTDEVETNDVAPSEGVDDTEETETSEETDSDVDADEATDTEKPLAPKSENRFQKLANTNKALTVENRQLTEQIKQLEQLQVPTEQDYIDGGYDPMEAKLNAMEAREQQRNAVEQVERLNSSYENDMLRVIHEYPQLDPNNKSQYNEALAIKLFTQYDKDTGAQYTDDGIVLNTNQLPHEYIKEKMDLIGIAAKQAGVTAQRNVEKMVAQADTPGSKAPELSKANETAEEMRERLANIKF